MVDKRIIIEETGTYVTVSEGDDIYSIAERLKALVQREPWGTFYTACRVGDVTSVYFDIALRCPYLGKCHEHRVRTHTANPSMTIDELMYRFDRDSLKLALAAAVMVLMGMKGDDHDAI